MSELILDESDPQVQKILAEWEDGGRYSVTITVVQKESADGMKHFDVESIDDYGDAEPAGEEEVAEDEGEMEEIPGEEMPKKMPKAVVAAVAEKIK